MPHFVPPGSGFKKCVLAGLHVFRALEVRSLDWIQGICTAGTRIFAAHVDPGLSESGFIVPGLGDAGDRCFGTL